jgi:hypothetical protein
LQYKLESSRTLQTTATYALGKLKQEDLAEHKKTKGLCWGTASPEQATRP